MRISKTSDGGTKFYFEFNENKLNDSEAFRQQLLRVEFFLKERYSIPAELKTLTQLGRVKNQFLTNKATVIIKFHRSLKT